MNKRDVFVIAAWTAVLFGLLEGIALHITREFPVILAPYKFSAHIIWAAPLIDLGISMLAALAWVVVFAVTPAGRSRWAYPSVLAFFVFCGTFAVFSAPKLIHVASAAALAAGVTGLIVQRMGGFVQKHLDFLRARILFLPLAIALFTLASVGYDHMREAYLVSRLPKSGQIASQPNVLIIVLDTVRNDRFTAAFRNDRLTPNLDRFARSGARFENAWTTSSWSLPSQASILTGRYAFEHQADWPVLQLSGSYPTIGEYLSSRGYVTAAFSGNSAWTTPEYLGRGFMRFQVYTPQDFLRRTSLGRVLNVLSEKVGLHYAGFGKKAPRINQEFLQFLDDYPDRPFFGYLCYMDVNQGFHNKQLSRPFWRQSPPINEVINAYDSSLAQLDVQIGELLDTLQERGVLDNTILIITSDHGESFGASAPGDHDPDGHGTSLYPEQTRVPLFVIYPGVIKPGQVIPHTTSLQAIPATILKLLGQKQPAFPGSPFPIQTTGSILAKAAPQPVVATLNYNDTQLQSVMWGEYLYIRDLDLPSGSEKLFDLNRDPRAQNSLSADRQTLESVRSTLEAVLNGQSQLPELP